MYHVPFHRFLLQIPPWLFSPGLLYKHTLSRARERIVRHVCRKRFHVPTPANYHGTRENIDGSV